MKSKEEKFIEKEFKFNVKQMNKDLDPNGTWGETLYQYGKGLFGKKFCGVYCQKTLPIKKIKDAKCLYGIFNNDYKGDGEHWLAFVVKGNQFYIWDSYGRSVDDITPLLKKRLKGQRIRFKMSDKDRNQTNSQFDCGSRCFAFLKCVDNYGIRLSMKI